MGHWGWGGGCFVSRRCDGVVGWSLARAVITVSSSSRAHAQTSIHKHPAFENKPPRETCLVLGAGDGAGRALDDAAVPAVLHPLLRDRKSVV